MNATVNVLCFKSKLLKNGEHPLMLCITKDRKRKYLSIGISVKAEHWDFKVNNPKRDCPNKELILNIIQEKTIKYRKQILEFQSIERDFSVKKLVETVDKPLKRKSVEAFFIEVIEGQMKEKRIGNAKSFRFALNSMKTFNGGNMEIPFTEIDISWLKKYESWMRSNGNSENTMGVRFRALRAIYNRAIQEHIVKRDYYPFNEYKVSKLKEVTRKRAISKAEIQKIIDFDVSNIKYHSNLLNISKDVFLFSYFGCGINFIDIAYLTKEDIQNGRIAYERHKTGKYISFLSQPYALEIIQKYNNPDSKYLFPILNERIHKTELQQYYRIRKSSKKVNLCLHKIGEAIDLPINLTTYVSRHWNFPFCLKLN